jgi:hypothetical protein
MGNMVSDKRHVCELDEPGLDGRGLTRKREVGDWRQGSVLLRLEPS